MKKMFLSYGVLVVFLMFGAYGHEPVPSAPDCPPAADEFGEPINWI